MSFSFKSGVFFAIGICTSMLLTGCGAKGPLFSELEPIEDNKSLVYLYRATDFVGGGAYFDVHATDKEGVDQIIGTLKNGGYFTYQTQPNEVDFWAKIETKNSVTLDLEKNKMYCIKGAVWPGWLRGRPHLEIVDNELCKKELKSTKLSTD